MKRPAFPLLLALSLGCQAHGSASPAAHPAANDSLATAPQGAAVKAPAPSPAPSDAVLDGLAQRYVSLVLALGVHDPDFVDAYYGPAQLREEVVQRPTSLEELHAQARALRDQLAKHETKDELLGQRKSYMARQLSALMARIEGLQGHTLSFDEESKVVYDAVSPDFDEAHFEALLHELDPLLPGTGPRETRFAALRKRFEIPKDKLDAVFRRALEGCRERTLEHIQLPPGERFEIEYVTDRPWAGYNWYKGNYQSLIQINTSLPIYIDRALDVACHEGYPGHHVYNVLIEQHLVRERGWVEPTVYALFSPQSLIAEGSANYGVELAFPGATRWQWERENLFPLAGLDPKDAETYYRALELTKELEYAGNVAARRYLDGRMGAEQAKGWLMRYTLASPQRAEQRVLFFDKYRAYVINYNVGRELVRAHIDAVSGGDQRRRWKAFAELLASPRLPADLVHD